MGTVKLSRQFSQATDVPHHLVDRIEAQLAFAAGLCDAHPDQAGRWRPLMDAAEAKVRAVIDAGEFDSVAPAVAEAEAILAPLARTAKRHTVHCVGHAHIDMNWMWSWPETVAVTLDTFSTVLKLMEEYPAFRFSQSQASTYAIVERHHPELLARIARRVREGRWEVTASHWVECDKNMTSAESLARQILLTRRYIHTLFGLAPEDVPVDWAADTFGHSATVPNYLVQGAVKYLYLHRPGIHTRDKHPAFWWEGTDGSRVLVQNAMAMGYNGVVLPGPINRHHSSFVKFTRGTDSLYVYGVGDHGGGPTRRDILCGLDMDTWPVFPNVRFSTARAFFEAFERQAARLPVVSGELNTEFTGCYTTQALIKRMNRTSENRLADAETAAVMAAGCASRPYPSATLDEAWRDTLFSQFHDILPGSCTPDSKSYTYGLYQKNMALTASIETQSLREIAARIDTSGAGHPPELRAPSSRTVSAVGAGVGFLSAHGSLPASEQSAGHGPRPVIVFNPTAFGRREIVEAVLWENPPNAARPLKSRAFVVRRAGDGAPVPAQIVRTGHHWGHEFAVLAFPAGVAGFGYAHYALAESDGDQPPVPSSAGAARLTGVPRHCAYAPPERSVEGIENDCLRLEIDRSTGGIRSLVLKPDGIDLIPPGEAVAPLFEYAVERPHGMSAWIIDSTGPAEAPALKSVARALTGPYKASLDLHYEIRESTISLTYELRAGDPNLYVTARVAWFERGTDRTGVPALSLRLPLAIEKARARYEIPFGALDRALANGEEVPALQWARVTGTVQGRKAGCLLVNDSKHGHSLDANTLRVTLLRSAYNPDPLPEIGDHEMRFAIRPFPGDLPDAEAAMAGQAFNRSLRAVNTDVHAGDLPPEGTFLTVAGDPVIVTALKRAESGDRLLLRLYNPAAKPAAVRIAGDRALLGRIADAQRVDLMERPHGTPVRARGGTLALTVGARQLVSLAVTVAAARHGAR